MNERRLRELLDNDKSGELRREQLAALDSAAAIELRAAVRELDELRGKLAAAVIAAGESRELAAGAVNELAGVRGELDGVRFDLVQAQARERAQLARIAQLESELLALVGPQGPGEVNG